jgi:polysaccharide biosynthesis protein PslF
VVVHAEAAREQLNRLYGADHGRVTVIAHGAAPNLSGPRLPGMPQPAILTWGLLRPGKGLEHGIAALARLGELVPAPWYVIAGQTHPKILAAEGDHYRDRLRVLAASLGVADRVRFDGGYQDQESLDTLVRSADMILLPYESREQISSGVLVEALAAGKPVIATRFPHALELLADGAGLLVDHEDVGAMAAAIGRVLHEPGLSARLAAAARRAGGQMMWQPVAERYRAALDSVVSHRAAIQQPSCVDRDLA